MAGVESAALRVGLAKSTVAKLRMGRRQGVRTLADRA